MKLSPWMQLYLVIASSEAMNQSDSERLAVGLLRFARNDAW
jgi:hypothetical protein